MPSTGSEQEFDIFRDARVIVALGKIAFDACLAVRPEAEHRDRPSQFRFGHGVLHDPETRAALFLPSEPAEHIHWPADAANAGRYFSPRRAELFREESGLSSRCASPVTAALPAPDENVQFGTHAEKSFR